MMKKRDAGWRQIATVRPFNEGNMDYATVAFALAGQPLHGMLEVSRQQTRQQFL